MTQDISDSKLKGLEGIQNLQNTNDAIDSLKEQANIDSLMGSIESTQEEGANMLTYFMDLIKTEYNIKEGNNASIQPTFIAL